MLALKLFEEAKKKKSLIISNKLDVIPFTDEIKEILIASNAASNKQIKVVNLAVDFYVCLFIQNVLTKNLTGVDGFDPANGKPCFIFDDIKYINWSLNFNKTFNERLRFIDSFMYTYLCAAVSGELRHAPGRFGNKVSAQEKAAMDLYGVTADFKNDQTRNGTQKRFLGGTTATQTTDFLRLADGMFNNYDWKGGYGGPKWGEIAVCGLNRSIGKLDKIQFIDLVFDLKHNGGPIFDKNKAVDNSHLQSFLDTKLEAKSEKDFAPYLSKCSAEVVESIKHAQAVGLWKDVDVKKLKGTTFITGTKSKASDEGDYEEPEFNPPPKKAKAVNTVSYQASSYPDPCPNKEHD